MILCHIIKGIGKQMFKYIPYIHKIKKEKREEQLPLYIENIPLNVPPNNDQDEEVEKENKIIIIQL